MKHVPFFAWCRCRAGHRGPSGSWGTLSGVDSICSSNESLGCFVLVIMARKAFQLKTRQHILPAVVWVAHLA